ncbi:putative phage major tail tube protein [Pyramidobacter piscolens W5455]|uniref:Phage major tail tube protein n=1 Tax=Pyramidobacter piscolens W5455 TaxID=352165 RepID=A0ABM9ZSY2_9BACT|nr:phage major tail tube protein [Pyramidobacter piscolens]EFB89922.1 putative phage major tail tube protein [Pyramidobacter piscolens W5455]
MPAIPERLINYNCYTEAGRLLGVTTVDMPQLQAMTDTVKGAGIAGEINEPTIGHYQALGATVHFNTANVDMNYLINPRPHVLVFLGSLQFVDQGSGELKTKALRVLMRAKPTNSSIGNADVSAAMDSSVEFSVDRLLITLDGVPTVDYDPLNFVCNIGGVDVLAGVRRDIQ